MPKGAFLVCLVNGLVRSGNQIPYGNDRKKSKNKGQPLQAELDTLANAKSQPVLNAGEAFGLCLCSVRLSLPLRRLAFEVLQPGLEDHVEHGNKEEIQNG